MDDRQLAFKILCKIERDRAYSNLTLESVLSSNEAVSSSFVSALVYGVVERKITLDFFLSSFLKQPLKKLKPQVLTILRMGVYQLRFMDKVPASAAVNESVKLTKKNGCAFASGLVNSVLRKAAQTDIVYPETDDPIYDMSIRYSCPEELVKHFADDYGTDTAKRILEESLGAPPLVLRVNTLKTDTEELSRLLTADGISCEKTEAFPNALILKNAGAVNKNKYYTDGYFHVQDTASQTCVKALDPQAGDVVFDMCSSPGGKAFTVAEEMRNNGEIYAFDLYEHRVKLIENGAKRLGISIIKGSVGDSSSFDDTLPAADKILCDVPCSGLGVIRRKPEIRYKDLAFIDKLCELQYNIINCAAKYLKKGGVLVYSTCSLNKAENQDVCDKFLSQNPDFSKVHLGDEDGYLTLFPHKNGTDGFFIAKFIKG